MAVVDMEAGDEGIVANWGIGEISRWYKRGKKKMDKNLRIEVLLNKVMNLDLYVKEMMELNLAMMKRIQTSHFKVVTVDTDSSGYHTSDEDFRNAADDCEH